MPQVSRVLHQGLAADKPGADATLNQGWLYYETDTDSLRQSWNGTWTTINVTAGSGLIATVDVGPGGAATAAFSTIPGTFRALRLLGQGRVSAAADHEDVNLTFNGDGGAHYDTVGLYTSGGLGAAGSYGTSAANFIGAGSFVGATGPADSADQMEVLIPNYADAVFQKSLHSTFTNKRGTSVNDLYTLELGGWWRSTAPITDILLTPGSGLFVEGTKFELYGLM